jgi:hypothetical protein
VGLGVCIVSGVAGAGSYTSLGITVHVQPLSLQYSLTLHFSEREREREMTMRSSVKINGVELTRAQIEGALKELNTPVNPTPAERHGLVRR